MLHLGWRAVSWEPPRVQGKRGMQPTESIKVDESPSSGATTTCPINSHLSVLPPAREPVGAGRATRCLSESVLYSRSIWSTRGHLLMCEDLGMFNFFVAFIWGVLLRVRNAALCPHEWQCAGLGRTGELPKRYGALGLGGDHVICVRFHKVGSSREVAPPALLLLTSPGALDAGPTCQDPHKIPRWWLLFSVFPEVNICLIVHLHCFSAFLMLSLFPDNKLYFLPKNSVYARVLGSLFAPFNFWVVSRKALCSGSSGFICDSRNSVRQCVWVFYPLPSVWKHLFGNVGWCSPHTPPSIPEVQGLISFCLA